VAAGVERYPLAFCVVVPFFVFSGVYVSLIPCVDDGSSDSLGLAIARASSRFLGGGVLSPDGFGVPFSCLCSRCFRVTTLRSILVGFGFCG